MRFAGYAAIFDRPDRGGDVIRAGAFKRSLESSAGQGRNVPLLWQHERGRVIGRIETLAEDARGLRVIATMDDAKLAAGLESGTLGGLSFGYRVRDGRPFTAPSRAPACAEAGRSKNMAAARTDRSRSGGSQPGDDPDAAAGAGACCDKLKDG
ncbi:MAG: HK97 family phage prohead protease [Pseudomonadota bacterium]